jgi:hypothetical protein
MIRRSTWILLAIFIVGVGAVFYLDKYPISSASVTPTATLLPPLFNNVSYDNLVMIEIQNNSGSAIQLKRNPDKTWGFTNIQGKSPDQGKVQELLFTLTGLTVTEGLNGSIALESVGLTTPTNTITLQDETGTKNILRIGAATSIGSGYYVQVNQNNPEIIDKTTIDNLIGLFNLANLVMATPTSESGGLGTPGPILEPTAASTVIVTPAPSETASPPPALSTTATP